MKATHTAIPGLLIIEPDAVADEPSFLKIVTGNYPMTLRLTDSPDFLYESTKYFGPEHERSRVWNDPDMAIARTIVGEPILCATRTGGL